MLKIKKSGVLTKTEWVYDEEKKEGSDVEKDITTSAISHLFDECEIEEGVTLKDIFLLLNTEIDIFDSILRNWCKELVHEGLTGPEKAYVVSDEEIEYLELYYSPAYSKYNKKWELDGFLKANLHGIGFERQADTFQPWNDEHGNPAIDWSKGSRTPWSLSFQKTYDLINIPIKLKNTIEIYQEDYDKNDFKPLINFHNPKYTLGGILYSIIWELSFHGGPDKRDKEGEKVLKAINEFEKT